MISHDDFQELVYDPICGFFQFLAIISTVFLVILIYKAKYDNLFNNCLWHMTIGLGIFDILSPILLFVPSSPQINWLQLVRHGASVWSYMVSSLLSYSVYYLVVYKHQLDFTFKNKKTQLIFGVCLVLVFIAFTIIGIIQLYYPDLDENSRHRDAFILFGTVVKMACSLYNMVNFIACEYLVLKNTNIQSFQFLAINTLMKRMKFIPIMQFVSQVLYFIGGFVFKDNTWINLDQPNIKLSSSSRIYYLFSAVFLYLDTFGIFIIYMLLHPNSGSRLKRIICCDRKAFDGNFPISSNNFSSNNNNTNNESSAEGNAAPRTSIFSIYRHDDSGENRRSPNISSGKVSEVMKNYSQDTKTFTSKGSLEHISKHVLELLSDSELSDIVEKMAKSNSNSLESFSELGTVTSTPLSQMSL